MYKYNCLYIQLHYKSINIRIRSDIQLSKKYCDLLRFLRISHFAICFDPKLYGYSFSDRIEINNESDQI